MKQHSPVLILSVLCALAAMPSCVQQIREGINESAALAKDAQQTNLIIIHGRNSDRYSMRCAGEVGSLEELARHTCPDMGYELHFREKQSAADLRRKLAEFRNHGIRVEKLSAPVYQDFEVSPSGELQELSSPEDSAPAGQ